MALRQFRDAIVESDLLSVEMREEFEAAWRRARWKTPADPADWLEQQGWVTSWQREQLLAGYTTFSIGNYRLLDHLGSGGSGSVYKARHESLDRIVAIKVLTNSQLTNPRVLPRFMREVQAAARLDHPNIITAHDAGVSEGRYFLVMEYADGRDLNAWTKHYGRLPVAWACEFIRQAALGLQHAHEQALVHRDIKPANLVVIWKDPHGEPTLKILDLGLARSIRETEKELSGPTDVLLDGDTVTQDGQIVGTPDYLSPEAIRGEHVDIRSDVFSLGCTLYKLLTGQIPFGGATVFDKLQNRVAEQACPAAPARSLCPDVPPALDAIIAKMLELAAEHRFRRPSEVAEALAPFSLCKNSKNGSLRTTGLVVTKSYPGREKSGTRPNSSGERAATPSPSLGTYEPPRTSTPLAAPVSGELPIETGTVAASSAFSARGTPAWTLTSAPPVAEPVVEPLPPSAVVTPSSQTAFATPASTPRPVAQRSGPRPTVGPTAGPAVAPLLIAESRDEIVPRRRRQKREHVELTAIVATLAAVASLIAILFLLKR